MFVKNELPLLKMWQEINKNADLEKHLCHVLFSDIEKSIQALYRKITPRCQQIFGKLLEK